MTVYDYFAGLDAYEPNATPIDPDGRPQRCHQCKTQLVMGWRWHCEWCCETFGSLQAIASHWVGGRLHMCGDPHRARFLNGQLLKYGPDKVWR